VLFLDWQYEQAAVCQGEPRMTVIDQGSIGLCDDCGGDRGHLYREVVPATVQGEPKSLAIYICGPCRAARNARSPQEASDGS
jgi:hypothetical protein